MNTPIYEIQGCGIDGDWSAEYCGQDHTTFTTSIEAEVAIESIRALGGEWASGRYRIVEVTRG